MNDFDLWNEKKQKLDSSEKFKKIYFRQGDVWWCSIGKNIGSEALGKGEHFRRPILVVKKLSKDSCIGVPLSTKAKTGTWYAEITLKGEKRTALLYQIRMFHSKRFYLKIGELDEQDFSQIKIALKGLLEIN